MNQTITWEILASYAGATAMTALIVQLTKTALDQFVSIPTQLYSYLVTVALLLTANFFIGGLTVSKGALLLLNALVISAASNGAYDGVSRAKEALTWHRD